MKKAICLDSVSKDLPLTQRLGLIKEAGFDGVEVPNLTDEQFDEMKEGVRACGLAVHSVMNSGHWAFPLSLKDKDSVSKGIESCKQAIKTAGALGADAILLVPAVVKEDITYEEAMARSKENVAAVIPFAAQHKIVIAVENVWNKFLLSPIEFVAYVDQFKSPYLRAYFDVGNILLYGFPQHWIRSLGKRIAKVHLKDFRLQDKTFVPLLEGNVNWPEVMEALRETGYDGYLTAEVRVDPADLKKSLAAISSAMDKIIAM